MRFIRLTSVIAAMAIVASACGSSASTAGPGRTLAPGESAQVTLPAGLPSMPAIGGGSCSVNITGDETKSWTSPQTMGSLLISYWLTPANRTLVALKAGEESLIFNCESAGGSVSFLTTNETTSAQFVKGPKEYVISAGGLLGGDPGKIKLLLNLKDESLWKVIEDGSFKITTFTGSKFSGTFSAKLAKADDMLKYTAGTAVITGTFDLNCSIGNACS